jgi:hypothetical protein
MKSKLLFVAKWIAGYLVANLVRGVIEATTGAANRAVAYALGQRRLRRRAAR